MEKVKLKKFINLRNTNTIILIHYYANILILFRYSKAHYMKLKLPIQ